MAGPELSAKYQTPIFLAGSASAEVIADIALCPWEAVKVCILPFAIYAVAAVALCRSYLLYSEKLVNQSLSALFSNTVANQDVQFDLSNPP